MPGDLPSGDADSVGVRQWAQKLLNFLSIGVAIFIKRCEWEGGFSSNGRRTRAVIKFTFFCAAINKFRGWLLVCTADPTLRCDLVNMQSIPNL